MFKCDLTVLTFAQIGFQAMEESDVEAIKGDLVRSVEAST